MRDALRRTALQCTSQLGAGHAVGIMALIPSALASALPEPMLVPLLDAAARTLRELEPEDAPLGVRRLLGFDRRGLMRSAARAQLFRSLEHEPEWAERVIESFLASPEVVQLVETLGGAPLTTSTVELAQIADRGELPLLASYLVAAQPEGFEFVLGVLVGLADSTRHRKADDDDRAALRARASSLEVALQRAESAKLELTAEIGRIDTALRDERRSRRGREEQAKADIATAQVRVSDLEREIERLAEAGRSSEHRAQHEAGRTRAAEDVQRQTRAELDSTVAALAETRRALERSAAPGTGLRYPDLRALHHAAQAAEALAERLATITQSARDDAARMGIVLETSATRPVRPPEVPSAPPAETKGAVPPVAPGAREREQEPVPEPVQESTPRPGVAAGSRRRAPVPIPPGMLADTPAAVAAALSGAGVAVVIDGYNVAMREWPGEPALVQRERLIVLSTALAVRTRSPVTIVFDGTDFDSPGSPGSAGARPGRRTGIRVVFSLGDETADDVIVREIAGTALRTPVLAVTSDKELRQRVAAVGALAISVETFADVVRR